MLIYIHIYSTCEVLFVCLSVCVYVCMYVCIPTYMKERTEPPNSSINSVQCRTQGLLFNKYHHLCFLASTTA